MVLKLRPATSFMRFRMPSPTRTEADESAEFEAYGFATSSRGRFCVVGCGRLERSWAESGLPPPPR
jgi:hypothetical protein